MPVPAVPVELAVGVRATLKKRARGHKTAHRDRQRALIVLLAARGWPNTRIAGHLGLSEDTVRTWRGRFAERGLPGLADLPRSGRPRRISALERAEVCALACQLPAEAGVPLARWSCPELAAELARLGLAGPMSDSSVRRILGERPRGTVRLNRPAQMGDICLECGQGARWRFAFPEVMHDPVGRDDRTMGDEQQR
jgi:transposase